MDDSKFDAAIASCIHRQATRLPVVENANLIMDFLLSSEFESVPVVVTDRHAIILDLSIGSDALGAPLTNLSVDRFGQLVDQAMQSAGTGFAFGRWGEPRELYSSDLFVNETTKHDESRSIHMGVDVFAEAYSPVFAPLDGNVHIKSNNAAELDYGPMLVLAHKCPAGERFYSLYGHLSLEGIAHITEGQCVSAGDQIATMGVAPENGNWPPHLHFQLILDLLGMGAEFPGVALRSQQAMWLALSPLPDMFFPECLTGTLDGSAGDVAPELKEL